MQGNDVINYEELSRIKVDGIDPKIKNQDARKVFIAASGDEFQRTSDFMLGNDDKNLEDGEYINSEEFLQAVRTAIQKEEVKKIIIKKTGKKISTKHLEKIIEEAKKSGKIALKENEKIKNQDARTVSIETPSMEKEKTVAGMMLGKQGSDLANGEYVKKEEIEFEVVSKKKVPVISTVQEKTQLPPNAVKLMKGLSTVAVSVGLVALLPYIMHANSVAWHHVGPNVQEFLHTVNLGLGKLIDASYNGLGLWTSMAGKAINADAQTASLGIAVGTYGVTAAGLTKIVVDIKNAYNAMKNKINGVALEPEKTNEEELGGKVR